VVKLVDCGEGTAMWVLVIVMCDLIICDIHHVLCSLFLALYIILQIFILSIHPLINCVLCIPTKTTNHISHNQRSDTTVIFLDENNKELGRDYFVSPQNQCTVSGYGNIKTITPRGGSRVFIHASADLCGKLGGNVVMTSSATSGQVTDCF
jgi:hypothetical protein